MSNLSSVCSLASAFWLNLFRAASYKVSLSFFLFLLQEAFSKLVVLLDGSDNAWSDIVEFADPLLEVETFSGVAILHTVLKSD